jgi:hypothetical protein
VSTLPHAQFVAAYESGRLTVRIDPRVAGRFMSDRLLLPFFALPVLGLGVALALVGWLWTGLAVIAAGMIVPRLIKRSAPGFILTHALADASFYDTVRTAGVLRVDDPSGDQPA